MLDPLSEDLEKSIKLRDYIDEFDPEKWIYPISMKKKYLID